jgi:hypothetical protein
VERSFEAAHYRTHENHASDRRYRRVAERSVAKARDPQTRHTGEPVLAGNPSYKSS